MVSLCETTAKLPAAPCQEGRSGASLIVITSIDQVDQGALGALYGRNIGRQSTFFLKDARSDLLPNFEWGFGKSDTLVQALPCD
jgi:hypothetical protein